MSDDVQRPATESFQELKERLKAEGQTKQDVLRETGGIDLDTLPQQARDNQVHRWVRRGLKMSCEGGNHPHHSHFLVG